MLIEVQVTINGSRAAIWAVITDIENASKIISGIEKIEVLEKPPNGLVGLRWRETRMLFGKPATAEKWITDAAEYEFYKTRAEDNGFVFLSTMSISETGGGITLTSSHDSQPQGLLARLQSIPMGLLFKGVAKKALLQDLSDIKSAVEHQIPSSEVLGSESLALAASSSKPKTLRHYRLGTSVTSESMSRNGVAWLSPGPTVKVSRLPGQPSGPLVRRKVTNLRPALQLS